MDNHPLVSARSCFLPMEGLQNARDLGGCAAMDGRKIRKGLLLRTAKLSDAAPGDIDCLLNNYHIHTIVDFRAARERDTFPDPVLSGVDNHHLRILDEDNLPGAEEVLVIDPSMDMAQIIQGILNVYHAGLISNEVYWEMLDTEAGKAGYRRFFDLLLSEKDGAILWHCTNGKDRTGIAAALLMTALGVDKETIFHEFLLTNEFFAEKGQQIRTLSRTFTQDPQAQEAVVFAFGFAVIRQHLEMVFTHAEEQCGSLLNYIQSEIGVSDAEIMQLKDKYLETI